MKLGLREMRGAMVWRNVSSAMTSLPVVDGWPRGKRRLVVRIRPLWSWPSAM